MSNLMNPQGAIFRPAPYQSEAAFEQDVVRLADEIFGSTSLYFDIKKHVGNDIVTIPDGYVIDLTTPDEPELFVVENEIAAHDQYRHIGIQMLRFVTAFDEPLAQRAIRNFLMAEILKNDKLRDRFENARKRSMSPNIDHYLDRAVYAEFKGIVVIDEATEELYRVLKKINADISVLEVSAFEADSGDRIFQFDTLYDDTDEDEELPGAASDTKSPAQRAARKERRANSDTVVVPAREEGFQAAFIGANEWSAIRISPAMKNRIKYIAAYRLHPIQAITHLAKVKEIRPFQNTGKYQLLFEGEAEEIPHVKLGEGKAPPRGPFYVQRQKLLGAKTIEDALAP